MVDSRAWMMDHKPQKKWDASENLHHKDTKCFLLPFSFSLQHPSTYSALGNASLYPKLTCSPPRTALLSASFGPLRSSRRTLDRTRAGSSQWSGATRKHFMAVSSPLEKSNEPTNYFTHLLGLWRVVLSADFKERKLIAVVVVHPFTEVVTDVESPAGSENGKETRARLWASAVPCFGLVIIKKIRFSHKQWL